MWKPIETAPKDGTYVLIKCTGTYGLTGKTFVPAVASFVNDAWKEVDECQNDQGARWAPKLWMELPQSEDGNEYVTAYDK